MKTKSRRSSVFIGHDSVRWCTVQHLAIARGTRRCLSWILLGTLPLLVSCSSKERPTLGNGGNAVLETQGDAGVNCVFDNTGCPCGAETVSKDCGEVKERVGDELWCMLGTRNCTNGVWGACVGQRTLSRRIPPVNSSRRLTSLASSAVNCGNLCDPQCNYFPDAPAGVDAGSNLDVSDAGMSINATLGGSCSTIIVAANPSDTVTLTDVTNPLPPASQKSITYTATCGAGGPPIQPKWSIESQDYDFAAINSSTGVLTVYAPVAKDVIVHARTGSGNATATAHIKIAASTGSCTNSSMFNTSPSITDPGMILYPYAIAARPVVFPLAMTAPLLQYGTGGTTASCVRTTLCFPSGACNTSPTGTPIFRWDKYVSGEALQASVDASQPAVTIDQSAWNAFSTSARSTRGDIVLQRLNTTPKLMTQEIATVQFASDALRGTVYFTQYQSQFSGLTGYPSTNVNNGQIASSPTCPVGNATHVTSASGSKVVSVNLGTPGASLVDAFSSYNSSGGCPVCHSVSPDGRTLVTTGNVWQRWSTSGGNDVGLNRVQSGGTLLPIADPPQYSFPWDSATWATAPNSTATNFPASGESEPVEDSRGWPYSAISPDGRYVLQGPNSWGNTRDDVSSNNAQDGSYSSASLDAYPASGPRSSDKRFFLMDTALYKPVRTWDASNPTASFESSIDHATDAPLPAYTGTSTVLTANANGALSIDALNNGSAVALATGQTLLVKNETGTNAKYNGIYVVSASGNSSAKWKLTRTSGADQTGELANDQRYRVDCGKTVGSSSGNTSAQFPVFFLVTSPDPITIGTSAINFAPWTTVRAATSAALPSSPAGASNTLTATNNVALSGGFGASDVLQTGMRILVKNQTKAAQNGIYSITNLGSSGAKWSLKRDTDLDVSAEAMTGMRVRVSEGSCGGQAYDLTTTGTITLNTTGLTFTLADSTDSLLGSTTMMVPQFSPDGTKLVYVNGDADTIGTNSTGWRRGLSMMDVNLTTMAFSNKRRLVNNYNASTPGNTIKWPFFENDSRSIVYVQSDPNEFCSRRANYGQCGGTCSPTTSIDDDIERACYQGSYGNMSPTTRGYWYGKLRSIDSANPSGTDVELAWLNNNNRATDATRMAAADANKAYQPTVLPFSAGGYRWVIFTSQRSYGNQLNPVGTHFSCSSALLWMAALDDSTAGATDRSHPAFLVPGQQIAKITNTYHYVNERGYIVPSPCKELGSACSVNAECCNSGGSSPTAACTINTPVTTPITRSCQVLQACAAAGQGCTQDSDCCASGSSCLDGICADPPKYYQAVYTRDYHVDCAQSYGLGYRVVWGSFFWHAQAAGSTSIAFSAQSNATGSFSAADSLVSLGTANSSNINIPPANAQSADISSAFTAASVPTDAYLRVTMTFNPSIDNMATPTLYDWNLTYSCKAAE